MEPADQKLTLTLFGAFEASSNGILLPGLQRRDGERLLALLALQQGRPIKSEALARTLWAASGSLDSLHQAVSHLRRALAEHTYRLQSLKGALLLDLAGAEVDVLTFDAALYQGDIPSLKTAVALYQRGPLLEGWDEVKDAWILPEREKRKRKYLEALKQLAADCMGKQDPAAATPFLRAYVTVNPGEERGWCDLMDALIRSGERVAAIHLYEKCRSFFQSKFHIAPPAEMVRRYQQIQPGKLTPAPEAPPDRSMLKAPRGVVLLESPFYILRPTDPLFAAALAQRESIVLVKGPRQTGKTSLLARGLQQVREAGANVVQTDLQSLSQESWASAEAFCLALAQDLADQLDLPTPPAEVWNPARGPNRNLQRYLCDQALERSSVPLVWGLDEVDTLFAYPFSTSLFALFRSWHNARALEPQRPWDRLTLAMAYATEAHLFIQDLNQSPFNVGLQLTLQDFSLPQIEELNARYGSPLKSPDQLHRYSRLVGGSPYLIHRGLYEMVTQAMDLHALEAQAAHDSGCFGDHLQRMCHALSQDAALCAVVRGLLEGRPCPTPQSFFRLKSAGVLVGEEPETATWRCALYRSYLEVHLT